MCSRRTKQIAQQLHWWAVQDWTTPSSNSFCTIKQIQNALMKSTRIAQWKLTFTLFEVNDIDLNFITKYPWYFYSVNTWNSLKFDLSYGPWNSVLKSLLTGLWPFFFKCWWEKIWQRLSLATVQASHKIRVSLYYKLGIVYSTHHVRFREGDWPHPILSFFLTIPHPFGTNFFLFLFFPFYKNHRWQL